MKLLEAKPLLKDLMYQSRLKKDKAGNIHMGELQGLTRTVCGKQGEDIGKFDPHKITCGKCRQTVIFKKVTREIARRAWIANNKKGDIANYITWEKGKLRRQPGTNIR